MLENSVNLVRFPLKGKLLMHLRYLWNEGKNWLASWFQVLERRVKTWTQPAPDHAIKGVVSDLFRSRKDLIAENAFLRQQVIVLSREKKRPPPTNQDRRLLVLLARLLPSWKDALTSSNRTL